MAAITILKDNVPHGPFTRAEVADQLTRGEVTLESLAFVEGLAQWTPLGDVLARVDALHPPPPVVSALPIGTGYAHMPAPETAAMIGTGYSYAATMQPPEHLVYAGFWIRFAAIFVDGLVLLPLSLVSFGLSAALRNTDDTTTKLVLGIVSMAYLLFGIVARWLYFALMESSKWQATLGKRLLGIMVTDRQGQRIGFGRATGRFFAKILSGLILCIGYMMAGWTQRKQALHDMLADTLVVRKAKV
jgi:uncharacterized RDD family membrane protein YckC